MKNRKSILVVFAILALLCLGIGYATLTDVLGINGTINGSSQNSSDVVDETLFDLEWDTTQAPTANVQKATGSQLTATAAYDGTDAAENNATITIENMCVKGEKVIATFTIKNNSNEDYYAEIGAEIVITSNDGSASWLEHSYRFIDDGGILSAANNETGEDAVIKPNGTVKLEVTIEMNKTLITGTRNEPEILNAAIEVSITGRHIDSGVALVLGIYDWQPSN